MTPPTSFESRLGPYRLLRLLGEGGMGRVYLGLDETLNRHVAVKILRTDNAGPRAAAMNRRFVREAQSAARLNHPNVVTIYSIVKQEDRDGASGTRRDAASGELPARPPYIVMEYVEGGSLAQRVRRDGPLYWRQALTAARDALNGLAAAHRAGIVHRDVKPANLMCARDPQGVEVVKLADFGLARVAQAGDGELTFPGAFVGSPSYSAPEQVAGAAQIDGRADLYSLAATLYALAAGQPPFVGEDPAEIMERQMRDPFPDVRALAPSAPIAFRDLIARASEKRPDKRFASAQKMLQAVDKLLALPAEMAGSAATRRTKRAGQGNAPSARPAAPPAMPPVSSADAAVGQLESRLNEARRDSDSGTQLETLRTLYGLYAQLDRRDEALRAYREALAVHVKMHAPRAMNRN